MQAGDARACGFSAGRLRASPDAAAASCGRCFSHANELRRGLAGRAASRWRAASSSCCRARSASTACPAPSRRAARSPTTTSPRSASAARRTSGSTAARASCSRRAPASRSRSRASRSPASSPRSPSASPRSSSAQKAGGGSPSSCRSCEEAHDAVRALLADGPPFDPEALGLDRHQVFLTATEAIFVFESELGASALEPLLAGAGALAERRGLARLSRRAAAHRRGRLLVDALRRRDRQSLLPPGLRNGGSVGP